jgi:serine/threonine protein phosphatase PrpC
VVDALIAEANGRGGLDNITAILSRSAVVGASTAAVAPAARRLRRGGARRGRSRSSDVARVYVGNIL